MDAFPRCLLSESFVANCSIAPKGPIFQANAALSWWVEPLKNLLSATSVQRFAWDSETSYPCLVLLPAHITPFAHCPSEASAPNLLPGSLSI